MIKEYANTVKEKIAFVYGAQEARKIIKKRKTSACFVLTAAVVCFLLLICRGKSFAFSACFSIGAFVFFVVMRDIQLFKAARNRRMHMRLELAEILDRLSVLLDAGVTLWNAVSIVSERGERGGAFEEELKNTVARFMSADGYFYEPESAFEEMASRCKDATVSTFVSLVVQNSRKGTAELADLLRLQAVNARNERRMVAKQLSDEAATLMLIPSALILAAVLVIVAAPAVIRFL